MVDEYTRPTCKSNYPSNGDRMKHHIVSILAATLALLTGVAGAAPAERPNILYIMSDDHAAHALSCYGSKMNQTPNLDRIAAAGMRFTNCYVTNSLCGP